LNKLTKLLFLIFLITLFACDAKLFESEEELPAPEVSDILTNLSNPQIFAGDSAKFWVNASNPGEGDLSYNWNKSAGEFLSAPDQDTISWRAPFQGGTETIEVSVANNDKTVTESKQIQVVSLNIPVVNIVYPKEFAYLIQYETIELDAEAYHDNGISYVEFFVNDSSLGILDGNTSNKYTKLWLNKSLAGDAEIKVTAVARSAATTGSDLVIVTIEGVIPGKK
jgi:hypothetical protein